MRSRFLILWVVAFAAASALIFAPSARVAQAVSPNIVISAIYNNGGSNGATYQNRYYELFNRGSTSQSLNGWSLQYASASGTSWSTKVNLPDVTLAPGQYFLISGLSNGANGTTYVTDNDDLVSSVNSGGAGGKVGLFSITTAFSGSGDPTTSPNFIDYIGYGTATNSEGATPAPAGSVTNMIVRNNGGCDDTDNNASDFSIVANHVPRNMATDLAPCPTKPDLIVSIDESQNPIATGGDVTYTVTIMNDGAAAADNVDLSVALSGTAGAPTAYMISGLTQAGAFCSTNNSTTVTCDNITSIDAEAEYVVSFTVTAAQVGQIEVATTVSTDTDESNDSNNTNSITTSVFDPAADLTVTTTSAPELVYTHSELTVTFTVSNGPLAQAEGVTLTATFGGSAFSSLGALPAECTLDGASSIDCMLGTINAGASATFTVPVILDGTGDVVVNASVATTSDEISISNNADSDTITVLPGCGIIINNIFEYQEGGTSGTLRNVPVVFEGVVTADFQEKRPGSIDGFYLQQVPGDGNPVTSDGIYVHYDDINVAEGDIARVYGTISEFNGLTQVSTITNVINCGTGATVTLTTVTLPLADAADWENYEGMLVTVTDIDDGTLTVADQFNLDNFGEMIVATQKLYQPTHLYAPGSAGEDDLTNLNNASKIIIDDGSGVSNPNPIPHYNDNPATHIRMGDSVAPITGVVSYGFNAYRVHYTEPLAFTQVVTRPTSVPVVGGRLKVGSFNVLNYFNGDGLGDGFPTSRGASNAAEFEFQTAKLVIAILKLDADILGLMEIENDDSANQAAANLVNALNAASAPGTYAYIDTGAIGTDEIKVAIIYQPASVTPQGAFAVDNDLINDRPTLAQTFTEISTGEDLTVVVNHFKSKGSCPGSSDPNADNGDGQSCWAPKRVQQATRLLAWLGTDPTGQSDADILILGDLNSYAKEHPITTLLTAGYTNLIEDRLGTAAHSYYFSGQAGYLDHALASAAMEPQVTGVGIWNINADEPDLRDYNDFANTLPYKETNEFRTSDHDPVLVGVSLYLPPEAFQLIEPAENAILRASTTTFSWSESLEATSYDVLLTYLSTNTRIGEQYSANVEPGACASGTCLLDSSTLIPAGLQQGTYSWTVVANGKGQIEASNGPNIFKVIVNNGIELVTNGGFEDGKTGWTFGNGGKIKCGGFGNSSNCALNMKPRATATQNGKMKAVLANVATTEGDVLQVSASVRTKRADRQRVLLVTIVYADKTAGAKGNGKDKIKLFVNEKTSGYQTFSTTLELDGAITGGKVVVTNALKASKIRVDDVSVLLQPIGTPRRLGDGIDTRSADGLLPPPSAPDGFRGNN